MEDEETAKLILEHIPEFPERQIKKCEWCHQPLPNERYHLRICPRCRKSTVEAFLKGEL